MARGVNKVILVGNVGADPEVRHTKEGRAIANLSIATTETWKDKSTGETREKTEWHRVVFFSKLAEIVQEYVQKGTQLYIEGKMQTRKWQDQNGMDRYTTEILGNEMQMLGSRNSGSGGGFGGGAAAPQAKPSGQPATTPTAKIEDIEDDIPF